MACYLEAFHTWHRDIELGIETPLAWKQEYESLQAAAAVLPACRAIEYFKTMRPFDELTRPLLGRYRYLRQGAPAQEKHLAAAFYPAYGFGCGRSHAYRQAAIQGSLFKLVTAYEAMVQRFLKMGKKIDSPQDLNPLIIVDDVYKIGDVQYVGYTEDGKPIPQLYKGGRLPEALPTSIMGASTWSGRLKFQAILITPS